MTKNEILEFTTELAIDLKNKFGIKINGTYQPPPVPTKDEYIYDLDVIDLVGNVVTVRHPYYDEEISSNIDTGLMCWQQTKPYAVFSVSLLGNGGLEFMVCDGNQDISLGKAQFEAITGLKFNVIRMPS